jgi:hypothetical protein
VASFNIEPMVKEIQSVVFAGDVRVREAWIKVAAPLQPPSGAVRLP